MVNVKYVFKQHLHRDSLDDRQVLDVLEEALTKIESLKIYLLNSFDFKNVRNVFNYITSFWSITFWDVNGFLSSQSPDLDKDIDKESCSRLL